MSTMTSSLDEDGDWVWPNRPLMQHYMVDFMPHQHGRWQNKCDGKKTFKKEELLHCAKSYMPYECLQMKIISLEMD